MRYMLFDFLLSLYSVIPWSGTTLSIPKVVKKVHALRRAMQINCLLSSNVSFVSTQRKNRAWLIWLKQQQKQQASQNQQFKESFEKQHQVLLQILLCHHFQLQEKMAKTKLNMTVLMNTFTEENECILCCKEKMSKHE